MKACPHCAEQIAQFATVCPVCKSQIEPESGSVATTAARFGENTPDSGGYLLVGALLGVIGAIVLGTSDGGGQAFIGFVIGSVGTAALLVGVIGHGVYIGMRQFDHQKHGRGPE